MCQDGLVCMGKVDDESDIIGSVRNHARLLLRQLQLSPLHSVTTVAQDCC